MNKIPSVLDLIGQSLVFPLTIDARGKVELASGWDVLRASVINILAWQKRYFLSQFGADLQGLLEDPNDSVTVTLMEYRIEEQLSMFDRRVHLDNLKIESDSDRNIYIHLTLSLVNSTLKETIIYPYNEITE